MALHVMDEANHCLGCKKPRCQQGCPIHTNIPEVIRLLKDNKLDDAGKMLFENNPLTTVCSPGVQPREPVRGPLRAGHQGRTRAFLGHRELHFLLPTASQMTKGPATPNGKKAAIIGSGPAGLTIAVILARYGYDVTIFESHDKIGGVLRYGIPEFRLPKSRAGRLRVPPPAPEGTSKSGPTPTVGKAPCGMEDLFRDGYKAIFIGTGVWQPQRAAHQGRDAWATYTMPSTTCNNPDSLPPGPTA